jgi:HAD superfamily hydrolase (TIGR01509 family)
MTPSPAVRAVVFDLDDTLFDCWTQCVGPAHREAAKAMVEAGAKASEQEVLDARLSLGGIERDVDDAVAAAFRSPSPLRVAEAGRRAFYDRDPGPLSPFPFARETLARVRERARVVLLTTGHPPTQQKKVAALGLADAFDEIVIDDVFAHHGKEEMLRVWLARSGFQASEVLVVGDRPDAEIAAARRLGLRALRVRGGEFGARPTPPGVPECLDLRGVLDHLGAPAPQGPSGNGSVEGDRPR